jgi:heme exporter protein C
MLSAMPSARRSRARFLVGLLLTMHGFFIASLLVANAPLEKTMGIVQKIFYFHVPCAWLLLLSTFVCAGGSLAYLFAGSERGDRLAWCSAELGVLFGLCVMVTGPLWARAAWGVFWTWDVRLTSSLLLWLMLIGYRLARRYGGAGGRRLAAAMALFAAADVPLVYLSVNLWRGLHPNTRTVSSLAPGMRLPFFFSLAIFSALWGVLLALRMRAEYSQARLVELAIAIEDAEGNSA